MRDYLRALDKSLGKTVSLLLGAKQKLMGKLRDPANFRKFPPDNGDSHLNILAIKIVGLGDSVLMLTAIDRLKKGFPNARIFALVTPLSRGVIEGQPQIERVILFDPLKDWRALGSIFSLIPLLKNLNIDCVLDFEQHFQSSAILSNLIGAQRRIGLYYGRNPRSMLFTDPVYLDPEVHMLKSYFKLLEPLGIDCSFPNQLVPIWVSDEDQTVVDRWLENVRPEGNLIGIHAGSGIRATGRRWVAERFAELVRRFNQRGFKVVLTGGKEEYNRCEKIRQMAGGQTFNCAGKFSIRQTAHLISRCILFISNDTGPMHISAAMGTPTVGLFGPNTPKRYRPIGKKNIAVYRNVPCSPCINVHLGTVPKCKNPICMESITVEDVWNEITRSGLIK
ncbi:MAG: glycosyltransferase family 9 protein [bacterium]